MNKTFNIIYWTFIALGIVAIVFLICYVFDLWSEDMIIVDCPKRMECQPCEEVEDIDMEKIECNIIAEELEKCGRNLVACQTKAPVIKKSLPFPNSDEEMEYYKQNYYFDFDKKRWYIEKP